MKTFLSSFVFVISIVCSTQAQNDVLQLDLPLAERLFLSKNYQLLASNYQIDQAKAEIITAKLFDNPQLSYENLFYNRETKRFFETSQATGQYSAQIAQLLKLAGKRKKSIQLAQSGVKITESEYAETLRNLRFQLRNTFYKAFYTNESIKVFDQEITGAEQMLKIYQQQLALGNVAQKEVIRIQSLVISLKLALVDLSTELEDNYRELKLLCNIDAQTNLKLTLAEKNELTVFQTPYKTLIDSAKANRADYRTAIATLGYQEANLKLQKAMAIPDIEFSLSYDLKGNYPEKYTGLGISIPLPLFNRNQGEIKKAKIGIESAQTNIKMYESLLENEVYNSYQVALKTEQQFQAIDPVFSRDFEKLMTGINKSFKERNISLIEFLDFYDSYKENIIRLNQLKYQRLSNREEINFVTGANIFNIL